MSPLQLRRVNNRVNYVNRTWIVGLVCSVLVHALIAGLSLGINSLQFGSLAVRTEQGLHADPLTVDFVAPTQSSLADSAAVTKELSRDFISIRPVAPQPIDLGRLSLLVLDDDVAPLVGTDGAEEDRLYERYTGQIQARITRIWEPPSKSGNESTSHPLECDTQIVQDEAGDVIEVLLLDCGGSPDWQRSLMLAIRQASPLPAPPSATVFRRSIRLHFIDEQLSLRN